MILVYKMKTSMLVLLLAILLSCSSKKTEIITPIPKDRPIQLHPKNPHYFLYKGKPLALITSAEHYGALINLDFDYQKYLEALSAEGMNYTRIFTGTYYEIQGESFGIKKNTLAPNKDKICTPWVTTITNSSAGLKYDLSKWNENYFKRLKDFMTIAAKYDIIVEVTLFSSIYRDEHWDINPQNPKNTINLTESITRFEAQTLNNGKLLSYQIDFVKKMVNELNKYDNFFFEIQNEPWSDNGIPMYNIMNKEDLNPKDWEFKADFATEEVMRWQERLVSVIKKEERKLNKKHLIAQNYTNFKAPIPRVNEDISIINFHYAWPEAVSWNYHYDKIIGFDETGFAGSGDEVYRRQAWQFMLSGGGLYNNLDYSFYIGNEDGLAENDAPGGGGKALRKQLKILADFLHSFQLQKLSPNQGCIESSKGLIPYILSDQNTTYAIYLRAIGIKNTILELTTGDGNFRAQILDPISGLYEPPSIIESHKGVLKIEIEIPKGELALKIIKV